MNYYNEAENYIKKAEVNKLARKYEENNELLITYWNVGRLIVEAQGGVRAKYGNKLLKGWAEKLTLKYGNGYNYTNLSRFRKFYMLFPIVSTVSQLSWSIISEVLPIKIKNKRNYYINLCITNNLSVRELRNEIKNNSYERLINKPKDIEIIQPMKKLNIIDNIKNPIIIEVGKTEEIRNESDLEKHILAKLRSFFNQLGSGFTLVDNQYKLTLESKNYYIDILLFNYKMNCFVVVELKLRELRKEDKAQVEFYMKLIDEKLKEEFHKDTIGIIISKEQNHYVANFVKSDYLIPLTYKVISK